MYAVFRTGGKQYRASEGDRLRVEKLDADEGADISFDDVLLVGNGKDIKVGTPNVDGTSVTARVVRQGKSRKVPVVKFRRRQNYLRQGSHRQQFTEVEITSIGGSKKSSDDAPAAEKKASKKSATSKETAKKKTAKKAAKKTAKKTAKKAAKKKATSADD